MKIIKLKSENVMRLNAVEIEPKTDVVIVGGNNEQGKTSVLDSILLALGGRKAKIKDPLKHGAKKGKIKIEIDGTGLMVTRTFTEKGGGALTVKAKDGVVYSSPQTMLDKISGELTFDPLAWIGMDDAKQLKVIKELTGVSFEEEDKLIKEVYDSRTEANKKLKNLKTQRDAIPDVGDVPDNEMSVVALMDELSRRRGINGHIRILKEQTVEVEAKGEAEIEQIHKLEQEIERCKENLKNLRARSAKIDEELSKVEHEDEAEIEEMIRSADKINNSIRQKKEKTELSARISKGEGIIAGMTDRINQLEQVKTDKLSNAKMPIEHLTFDESGVFYKGIPFTQVSSAEKLRVSVAMGIAMNPELKVLLIRDGSLLDKTNLKLIQDMAFDSGHQIWIERVSTGEECSIIIEDGNIKEVSK